MSQYPDNYYYYPSIYDHTLYPDHSVKVEPDDFIMELSPNLSLSLTGPMDNTLTEVPLRATQASKDMRKMMGVFRLNPFAMHSGEGRGVMPALWCGGGPLDEEPLIFEFQLDIDGDEFGASPTDLDEPQLRSFSPSFQLHPEDLKSDMGEEHEQELEDSTEDPDQQNEWSDADCGNQSEVDTSSTTHSVHTPSETRSQTAFNESSSVYQYPASTWDIDSYQTHAEELLPPAEKMEGVHKMHRVHTTSHPYLRRSLVNHQVTSTTSPSSSTHSLSQSHPHLHNTQQQPQLNFEYSHHHLQHPTTTTTTHFQHYNNNQVPNNQDHNSQTYHHHVHHDSMISSSPLELIPAQRPENSVYSSYIRSGRRSEDETSVLHHHHHHHPAGIIVNEYNNPRGTGVVYATSQHDSITQQVHHQYEHSSSGHDDTSHIVFSPSRRWSLPETIGGGGGGGPFRSSSSSSTM